MGRTDQGLTPDQKAQLVVAAQDLRLLARFSDRELEAVFLKGLRKYSMAEWIGVELETEAAQTAAANLDHALQQLPSRLDDTLLDELHAEFADIFLNHSYRVAPTGSVWLTEDSLERQEPMFAVRDWYKKYDMEVPDWRLRSDDHIVHELQFLAHLCDHGTEASARDAVQFLDQHMLNWVPGFAKAVVERACQPIYIESSALLAVYLEEIRDFLESATGIERPTSEVEVPDGTVRVFDIDRDRPYMPGLSESW